MESLNSAALTNPEQAIKGLPPYSAVEALQRLQTLQRVCATLSLDGILFVGGVDGKHHEASHEVLAWLLNGESGRVVFGRGSSGVDMEEVVLVITPTAARLYCPAAIWQALAPRLGLWPRLQVHSPAASLEEAALLEEHKIRAFIAMLEGLHAVGIPLPEQGDAKPIEQWPLVQAYALQDFEALTGGGFLTQRLRCVTCAGAVVAPLALVDARALHWLVRVEAPRLRGCWEECERGLDQACGARPLRASEGTLCEAPLTYADYGRLRPPKLGLLNPRTGRVPLEPLARTRLLLGARTALCEGGEPCSTEPPGGGGQRACEPSPRHLILEAAEPHGPLYAGRVYFLGLGAAAPPSAPVVEPEKIVEEGPASLREARARVAAARAAAAAAASATRPATEDARAADSKLLQGLFGALQAAVDEVVEAHGVGATAATLGEEVAAAVARRAAAAGLATPAGWSPRVAVQRQLVDLLGTPREDGAAAGLAAEGRLMLQLRVMLLEVPAPADSEGGPAAPPAEAGVAGATLGALLVGHTLLAMGGHEGGAPRTARLSAALPQYGCWRAPGPEYLAGHELLSTAESLAAAREEHARTPADAPRRPPPPPAHPLLGNLLAPPVLSCSVLSGSLALPPVPVTLYAFERGAVLAHARMGPLLLRFDCGAAPRAVTFYESGGGDDDAAQRGRTLLGFTLSAAALEVVMGAAAALIGGAAAAARGGTAAGEGPGTHEIGLACLSTQAHRILSREVLPQWKTWWKDFGIPYAVADAPPPLLGAARLAGLSLAEPWPTRQVAEAAELRAAAEAHRLGARPAAAVGAAGVGSVAGVGSEVLVLLLVGAPGSGAHAAAGGLVDAHRSSAHWLAAPPASAWCAADAGCAPAGCDVAALRGAMLGAAHAAADAAAAAAGGTPPPMRMVLVAESLAPLPALAAALTSALAALPSADEGRQLPRLRLAAAVACLDAPRAAAAEAVGAAALGAATVGSHGSEEGVLARCAPGVLEHVAAGFAQAVLLCQADEVPPPALAGLSRTLAAASPHAAIVRAARGPRAASGALASLLGLGAEAAGGGGGAQPGPLPFDAPKQQAMRDLVAPGWQLAPPPRDSALQGVLSFALPPPPPCNVRRLLRALRAAMPLPSAAAAAATSATTAALAAVAAAAGAEAAALPAAGEAALPVGAAVLLVQGTVVDAASGVAFELDLSPRVFREPRAADAGAAASPLLVSCRGAEARAVAELLLACRDLPARAVPATELSKEAMARVREKVKEAPLPEGIFYDGRGYIDGFGDWTADHPALEAAVEAEMRALNAEAERCNAALATQHAAAQAEAAAYLGCVQGSIEVD